MVVVVRQRLLVERYVGACCELEVCDVVLSFEPGRGMSRSSSCGVGVTELTADRLAAVVKGVAWVKGPVERRPR